VDYLIIYLAQLFRPILYVCRGQAFGEGCDDSLIVIWSSVASVASGTKGQRRVLTELGEKSTLTQRQDCFSQIHNAYDSEQGTEHKAAVQLGNVSCRFVVVTLLLPLIPSL
jgi:hypothetical protein